LSNIRVGTISGVNGTDPVTLTKQSAVKTFVLYDQTAPSIGSSLNVSSMSDDATGSFEINFSTNYASQSERCFTSCGVAKGASLLFVSGPNDTSVNKGGFESINASGSNHDGFIGLSVHGDLA